MSKSQVKQTYEPLGVGLPGARDVSVDALIDDWEGFRVLLRNHQTNAVTRIAFDTHLTYQSRDESDFALEATRSDGLGQACLYRVTNSDFLQRYIRDSLRVTSPMHFAILTGDVCIDVIAEGAPRIEDLKEVAIEMAARSIEGRKPS